MQIISASFNFNLFILFRQILCCLYLQLQKKIAALEGVNLTEKTWQMSGEAGAKSRPINR